MQITCPCCGARFSIEAVLSDASARRMLQWALKMPAPVGDPIIRYIALFRPENRALSWSRAEKLLHELQADIERGEIRRRGRTWSAPIEHWKIALEEILGMSGKLTLPLKSHGYLYEILAGMADKIEAKHERDSEKLLRTDTKNEALLRSYKSELKSLQTLFDNSPNEMARKSLKKQMDEIQLKIVEVESQ